MKKILITIGIITLLIAVSLFVYLKLTPNSFPCWPPFCSPGRPLQPLEQEIELDNCKGSSQSNLCYLELALSKKDVSFCSLITPMTEVEWKNIDSAPMGDGAKWAAYDIRCYRELAEKLRKPEICKNIKGWGPVDDVIQSCEKNSIPSIYNNDWKVYLNNNLGFRFDYPPTEYITNIFDKSGTLDKNQYFYSSIYPKPTDSNPPDKIITISVEVPKNVSVPDKDLIYSSKVMINGHLWTYNLVGGSSQGDLAVYYITNNNKMYIITFTKKEHFDTFDKIFKSIRFI